MYEAQNDLLANCVPRLMFKEAEVSQDQCLRLSKRAQTCGAARERLFRTFIIFFALFFFAKYSYKMYVNYCCFIFPWIFSVIIIVFKLLMTDLFCI